MEAVTVYWLTTYSKPFFNINIDKVLKSVLILTCNDGFCPFTEAQFLQTLFTYHENEKMVKSDKNKVACKYNHRNMS